MAVQIQLRRDTAANWTAANPTLASGEVGLETNTGKFKFGSGATAWNSLGYASSAIEVKEVDGAPDVTGVNLIIVSNGTLTDNGGGSVTITTGGGAGGGAGGALYLAQNYS